MKDHGRFRMVRWRHELRTITLKLLALASVCALPWSAAQAQSVRPLNADSFRLGSGGGAICQVQSRSADVVLATIFDRAWSIVCRDSARAVGRVYALRGSEQDLMQRLSARRKGEANCAGSFASESLAELGEAKNWSCMLDAAQVGYKVIVARKGNVTYVAEGLGAYDSALKLAMRSIAADKVVPGKVEVVTTPVDDPAAFARVQASTLDADKAMAEGYRRNNAGNYAEAAEFFDTLRQRVDGKPSSPEQRGEYLVNQALQKSNLGDFAEAGALFDQAEIIPTNDRVQVRLRRNYAALHHLNQQHYDAALATIKRPVAPLPAQLRLPSSAIEIGAQVAAGINSGLPVNQRLSTTEIATLTPEERARFLDAQALSIEGTVLRLQGKPAEGRQRLETALTDMLQIRDGRVVSIIRLRSQVTAEIGLALEDENDLAGAEARLRESVDLLQLRYPQTVAVNGARARLAAYLARHGKDEAARAEYRQVVNSAIANQTPSTGMGNLLAPYFQLLTRNGAASADQVGDVLLASQTLIRPGVADTQAILARELNESDSEAARLFRQSRSLTRDLERSRIELATLVNQPNQTADIRNAISIVERDLAALEAEQTVTQSRLAEFSQYRAISNKSVALDELRGLMRDGEAYLKMVVAGNAVFGIYADKSSSSAWRIPLTPRELQETVDLIRDSIAKEEGGQVTTYAYEATAARKLFVDLAGPAQERILAAKHIIFEPDGAMLQLPLNLLIADQKSVDDYNQRVASGGDEFDLTGVNWLGRNRAVSTAVSLRAFRDTRGVRASLAKRQYLGLGRNLPITTGPEGRARTRGAVSGSLDCSWPASLWSRPISDAELNEASATIGAGVSEVIAGATFSDSSIRARTDLADFRIIHFATHGLVTAPRPECPARPALVTSFASDEVSDGLLTFREIFDLKLDADLIILSACDTAGKASVAATREAGVTSGGGSALDGLVRAFVGAGGRSVIASHWPAPDDFDATKRLISGLFKSTAGGSVGTALGNAQIALMDDATTSHPYYWAGFAIVGDAERPLLAAQ